MSEVKKFDHVLFGQLRVEMINDEPWVVANDVTDSLGYKNGRDAVARHVETEDRVKRATLTAGGMQDVTFINEAGVVNLVSYSRNGVCESIKQAILDQMPNGNYIATVTRDEHVALKTIEQLLGISLIRQYRVDDYRVDGYHPESNTVYEVYEPYHNMCVDVDKERQAYIENKLGCNFVIIRA